ncbi:hypothetical protein [Paraburkholderia sp. MM6662-R1]|uniref:hypothetical protein n=1 Tax=Paraburkholderia sp. MM6662-R1 TaxID=2991066 RepID=UPI003D1911AF
MPHAYARNKTNGNLNNAEKRLVAAESLRLMKEDAGLSRIEALRRGMSTLDKSRQKPVIDMAHAKWVIPLWEEMAAERDAMNGEAEIPTASASALPENTTIPTIAELSAPAAASADAVLAADSESEGPPEASVPVDGTVRKKTGGQKGSTLVRWNGSERKTVAKGFLKLKADFPDMKDLDCLRKSMQYNLPDHRQRKIVSCKEPWFRATLDEIRAEAEREIHAAREQREAQLRAEQDAIDAAKERETAERLEAERIEQERAEAVEQAVEEYRANASLEELLLLVAKKAAGLMVGSLVETLQTQVLSQLTGVVRTPMSLHMPGVPPIQLEQGEATKPAPRDRLPRVLVIGLMRQQTWELKRAMDGILKLDFIQVEHTGGSSIEEKARNADLVVLMTKFISHQHTAAAKKANSHVVYRNGGVSELKRWLTSWVNGEIALAA